MIDKATREKIISLIHREVVPALGCTEPIAVSLAVAKATELLGMQPEEINLGLSGNIIKNAMGVGIPGTGMIGLPIAIALGSLIGKSEYGLEVLKEVSPEAVERGKAFIESVPINIKHLPDSPSNLHVDVEVRSQGHSARAVISREHTLFVLLEKDSRTIFAEEEGAGNGDTQDADDVQLNFRMVFDFATTAPLEEIRFMKEAQRLNEEAAEFALKGDYGHSLGAMIRNNGVKYMGDSTLAHMVEFTSAACDARMGGATVPVMSNSGSGNQGLTASLPVIVYAKELGVTQQMLYRALAVSNLVTIHLKTGIGSLSAYCGATAAGCGAAAGVTYLYGGQFREIAHTVVNAVAIASGMICDGAKASCAAKIASAVEAGLLGMQMQMHESQFYGGDGIVVKGVENTIRNIGTLASEGMREIDRTIIRMMIQEH